jgi:clan AA aspartic protease (TIGR02281 family)
VPQPVPQVVNPPAPVILPKAEEPPKSAAVEQPKPPKRDAIPINAQNGKILVSVGLGDRTVTMLLDTGASTPVVTGAVADGLVRAGHARWAGMEQYSMADGTVRDTQTIVIFEVKIGNQIVRNVKAGIVPTGTDMLLGLSILQAIGPFLIDTRNQQLVFMPAEASL